MVKNGNGSRAFASAATSGRKPPLQPSKLAAPPAQYNQSVALKNVYNPSVNRGMSTVSRPAQSMTPSRLNPTSQRFLPTGPATNRFGTNNSPPTPPSTPPDDFADLTAGMAQMKLAIKASPVLVASLAPTPSTVTTADHHMRGRNASQISRLSQRPGPSYGAAKLSKYMRKDFELGDIISLPFHTPNMNPTLNPKLDLNWVMTLWSPVYSKRRLVVVIYKHETGLFYLPLYT